MFIQGKNTLYAPPDTYNVVSKNGNKYNLLKVYKDFLYTQTPMKD